MDNSMATATNNGGGTENHRSSLQHSSAYRQLYSSQNSGDPSVEEQYMTPILFLTCIGVVVLLRLLCCRKRKEEEEARGGDRLGQPPLETSRAGRLADRDPSTVAALEMAPVGGTEPPLVCTYRKSDGWKDDSCGVCLAELADGEALRVLPACMHFFHAACVNEWLRAHNTCPLCRASLVAPADATKAAGPATSSS